MTFHDWADPAKRFPLIIRVGDWGLFDISTTDRRMLKGFRMVDETKQDTTEEQQAEQRTDMRFSEVADHLEKLKSAAHASSYSGQLDDIRSHIDSVGIIAESFKTELAMKQPSQTTLQQELADLKAALQIEIDLRKEAEAARDRAMEKHEKATVQLTDIGDMVSKAHTHAPFSSRDKTLSERLKWVLDDWLISHKKQVKQIKQQREELESLRAKLADASANKWPDEDPPHYIESKHLIGKVTKPEQAAALDKEIELLKNNGWWVAHETVNTIVISDNAPKMPSTTIKSLKIMRWERVVSIEAKQQPDDEDSKTIDMPAPDSTSAEEGTDAAAELQEKAS